MTFSPNSLGGRRFNPIGRNIFHFLKKILFVIRDHLEQDDDKLLAECCQSNPLNLEEEADKVDSQEMVVREEPSTKQAELIEPQLLDKEKMDQIGEIIACSSAPSNNLILIIISYK